MQITTYSNFRQNLKVFLDNVFVNHDPLFVTRTNGEDVVVLSKTDYESLTETLHLLGNPNVCAVVVIGFHRRSQHEFL